MTTETTSFHNQGESAEAIAKRIKDTMTKPFDMRSSEALIVVTLAEQLANKVLSPGHLTMDDAMRASHPGAGAWMDQTKETLDKIHAACQSYFTGKPGAMDAIEHYLKQYGYKFLA